MTMQMRIYHLRARSPFHFGERGVGLEASAEFAHADTVFSALCSVWRELYGTQSLEELLSGFLSDPPFLLSSAFPYAAGQDGVIRFYPRPFGTVPGLGPDDYDHFKRLKGVQFVSETIFRLWVEADHRLAGELPENKSAANLLHGGKVWFTRAEADGLREAAPVDAGGQPHLWKKGEVPRVTVDRLSSSSAVYQAGRVTYAPGGGLWIGFVPSDAPLVAQVEEVLAALGDAGLGGERSAGHGQFDMAGSEDLVWPDPNGYSVSLSPFWPANQEQASLLSGEGSAYSLLLRRGWIGSPEGSGLRRKAVRMLAEGSVLDGLYDGLLGGLADVTPDVFDTRPSAHPVYRYGYALPVGMKRGAA